MDYEKDMPKLREIILEAGALTLEHFKRGTDTERKADGSPVTIADQEAEGFILKELSGMTPEIPVVAEESVSEGRIPDISKGTFWLVDPLDGTREFINGSGEYTVNIALIANREPVLGFIYAPVLEELYSAHGAGNAFMSKGGGSPIPIHVRPEPAEGLTVVASRSHGDPARLERYLDGRKVARRISRGSSLKLCMVAAGEADVYPRFGPTCEWDIAAGDAILRCAGGAVTTLDGTPLTYGKADKNFLNPEFIARAA